MIYLLWFRSRNLNHHTANAPTPNNKTTNTTISAMPQPGILPDDEEGTGMGGGAGVSVGSGVTVGDGVLKI